MKVSYRQEVPFGHRLQAHGGKCRFPHGHNYVVDVRIVGSIDVDSGMVIDFSDLKRLVREMLDPFDHAFVLQDTDPLVVVLEKADEPLEMRGTFDSQHRIPTKVVVLNVPPTAENIALLFREHIRQKGAYASVTVWEQEACSATCDQPEPGVTPPQIVRMW